MTHRITTPPAEEALESFLPLSEARKACLVYNTTHDARIKRYRRAAVEDAEFESRCSILPQTIEATFIAPRSKIKNFGMEQSVHDPDGIRKAFRLPRGHVVSITSILFIDASGEDSTAIPQEDYVIESGKFLRWRDDIQWPDDSDHAFVRIVYEAGIVTDVASPQFDSLRLAVEEILAAKWDAKGGSYKMPTSAQRVLRPLRTSLTYVPGTR